MNRGTGTNRREMARAGQEDTLDPRPWLAQYIERRWHVFPVLRSTKRPLVHWPTLATTNFVQIEAWLREFPGCAWGINVGKSGLWVVDCDTREGLLQWQAIAAEHQDNHAIETVVLTGGRGYHIYFSDPFSEGVQSVRRLGTNIDTRADGGYVIAPPSLHESGRRYTWLAGIPPARPIPLWITETLRPRSQRPPFKGLWTCGRGKKLLQELLRAAPSEREKLLKQCAMHVGRESARGHLADVVLADLANAAIVRGLSHEEAYRIAHAAHKSTSELR